MTTHSSGDKLRSWENWGLQKRLKFCNWTYFARKHYFLLWMKETAFFAYFYHGIIFYSTLSYLTVQSTLNFTRTSLYFKRKHKSNIKGAIFELRINHLFQNQPYKEVLELKCQACNFTDVLFFTDVFGDFSHISQTCFFAELLIT